MPGDPSTPTHLRALANAASPGPWRTEWDGQDYNVLANGRGHEDPIVTQTFAIATWEPEATQQRAECDTADADLIATVASPPVVLALADHLEALAAFHEPAVGQPITFDEVGQAIRRLLRTRDALEAAIHRTPEGAA